MIEKQLKQAKRACLKMQNIDSQTKIKALQKISSNLLSNVDYIINENGEKYIYAKDHYYSKYRVVRHGESHRYSISRETASLDELMEFFDVTELNKNTVDESVDGDIESENQIHLAGTDNDYEVFFDDIRDPSEEYEDDDEEDEYAEDEYYQNDYSKSEISINLGEDDYDDEEY